MADDRDDPLGAAFLQDHPFDLHHSRHHQPLLHDDNHYRLGLADGLDETLLRLELLDATRRQLLVGFVRRLIMIINSILGLSLDKLAKYYFGPDFWAILAGRLLCLCWWASAAARHQNQDQDRHSHNGPARSPGWRRWLPLSRRGLVKLLLVLAYTQMLIQQMDNRDELAAVGEHQASLPLEHCCHQDVQDNNFGMGEQKSDLVAWFECVWSNARSCGRASPEQQGNRAERLATWLRDIALGCWHFLASAVTWLQSRLLGSHLLAMGLYTLWVARWRSIIVQRLVQSMLLQLLYIGRLLFAPGQPQEAQRG